MRKFTISLLLCLFGLNSCASTRASYIPVHAIITIPKVAENVQYFVLKPQAPAIALGYININGNSFASHSDVVKEAKRQAAALGADFILEEKSGVETIAHYNPGYTSVSMKDGFSACAVGPSVSTEELPWAVFSAWVYQPANTGVNIDDQAIIQGFHLNSDAESAGLRIGDEVIGIDGFDINDPRLPQHLMEIAPGDSLIYTIRRNDLRYEFTITALP